MPPLTDAQIKSRSTGIGASEVAAVVGLSPWEGPLEVWSRKKGLWRAEQNDAMDLGNRLEPVILGLYSDRVKPAKPWTGGTVRHPEHTFALASPDGKHVDSATLVECKAVGWRMAGDWGEVGTDAVPDYYACQAQWQMFFTGAPECHIAALIGGEEFKWYALARHDGIIASLVERVGAFWRDHVLADRMPDPMATRNVHDAIAALFPRDRRPLEPWTLSTEQMARELAAVKARKKAASEEEERLKIQLQTMIGDSAGFGDEVCSVTWKANAKGKVAWAKVAAELSPSAELIAKHTGKPNRVLRLKGFNGTDDEGNE